MDAGWPPASDAAVRRGARDAETRTTKWPGTLPATEGAEGPKKCRRAHLVRRSAVLRCGQDLALAGAAPSSVLACGGANSTPSQFYSDVFPFAYAGDVTIENGHSMQLH